MPACIQHLQCVHSVFMELFLKLPSLLSSQGGVVAGCSERQRKLSIAVLHYFAAEVPRGDDIIQQPGVATRSPHAPTQAFNGALEERHPMVHSVAAALAAICSDSSHQVQLHLCFHARQTCCASEDLLSKRLAITRGGRPASDADRLSGLLKGIVCMLCLGAPGPVIQGGISTAGPAA